MKNMLLIGLLSIVLLSLGVFTYQTVNTIKIENEMTKVINEFDSKHGR